MKKYKIGNRIITADSPINALKTSKLLDKDVFTWANRKGQIVIFCNGKEIARFSGRAEAESAGYSLDKIRQWDSINDFDDLDFLTEEEFKAVEDYKHAIKNSNNPKLLKLYKHILEEEIEHINELQKSKFE